MPSRAVPATIRRDDAKLEAAEAMDTGELGPALRERVLSRLGFSEGPSVDLEGLKQIYRAWCGAVPFDNARKLLHVRRSLPGVLPGDQPGDFFEAWLRHGCGGTCWAGNGALYELLSSLGFQARRGLATMLSSPNAPPGHGTVCVSFENDRYLVDASMLHGAPLRLDDIGATSVEERAWGLTCGRRDGRFHIPWRPLHRPAGFDCRIEHFDATRAEFRDRHEATRGFSPFNFSLTARLNVGQAVLGLAFGRRVELRSTGGTSERDLTPVERMSLLVDDLGFSEALVSMIPADLPTPPRP